MAYNKNDLEKEAIRAIKENNLTFDSEVWVYLGISEKTYYNHELQKLQSIKEAIKENRVKTKNNLKAKWFRSSNATLQVALYKLISDDEERKKLSQTYNDITTNGENINKVIVEFAEPINDTEDNNTA